MKKKKKGNSNVFLILVFLAGLSFMLYPTVSNYLNSKNQHRIISYYQEEIKSANYEQNQKMLEWARKFNAELNKRENPYMLNDKQQQEYESLLNISRNGVMGYLEIPCIDCILPIYHGVGEEVLQTAIGHIEWTSLPVGGESTHAAISGHRGLPSADLLTHIDKMRIGDKFYVNILGEKLLYKVDQIKVVLPDDTSLLMVEEGKDYLTLVTCTPYGINSHRLLVRGTRVTDGAEPVGMLFLTNEIEEISMVYLLPVVLSAVLVVFMLLFALKTAIVKKPKENPRD